MCRTACCIVVTALVLTIVLFGADPYSPFVERPTWPDQFKAVVTSYERFPNGSVNEMRFLYHYDAKRNMERRDLNLGEGRVVTQLAIHQFETEFVVEFANGVLNHCRIQKVHGYDTQWLEGFRKISSDKEPHLLAVGKENVPADVYTRDDVSSKLYMYAGTNYPLQLTYYWKGSVVTLVYRDVKIIPDMAAQTFYVPNQCPTVGSIDYN